MVYICPVTMEQLHKIKSILSLKRVFTTLILFTLTWNVHAQHIVSEKINNSLTRNIDSNKIKSDAPLPVSLGTRVADTTKKPAVDTSGFIVKTDTFSLKISKDTLDAPLHYKAEDSAVGLVLEKKIILYGKTKTEYKDIVLTAPRVEMDQTTQIVTAVNRKDSSGAVVEAAQFKDESSAFTSDTIRYNFKTQIGQTKNTFTEQDGILIIGEVAKKVSADVTFVKKGRFTTCMLDEPHYDFLTSKMKVVNKKVAIAGPTHLEFEGVPIPLYLPFGYFPLQKGMHSGLLPPQFATNEQYGLGLEGLGYYKVINQYWDAKIYGNIYSYGGWSVNLNPSYRKRYRYNGAFNLSMQSTKLNFKGDPDFSKTKTFSVNWYHSVDSRARPGTQFSANVSASSTKFNRLVPNSPQMNFQNIQTSSIAYSKSWAGKPYNLTMSANHSQNNFTHLINLSLPDVGFTVNTQYPFQKKNGVGAAKWYEKLGIGYFGNFRNQVSFYDTAFSFRNLIDTLQWGAQHNFPITLSLPPIMGGAVIVSPNVSIQQVWIAQKFRRTWNNATQKIDTSITKGIFMDQQVAFGLSFNTAMFGTLQFKRKTGLQAIRHVVRPSFSVNYKPDLSKNHFYKTQINSAGYLMEFSEFEGALYPGFSKGKTGGFGFQIDNNVEYKWRKKSDTTTTKITAKKLIDGFGISGGYNFLRDSLKLDIFNLYFRTTLFDKINISANSALDPYQVDSMGRDINKYLWQGNKFQLGRLTYGTISVSSNFKSKPKDAKKEEAKKKMVEQRLNDPSLVADQRQLMAYMQQNPGDFVDFNIPWQLNVGYSLTFYSKLKSDYSGFTKEFSSNLNFNGSFNLTPKWNFSTNGFYDLHTKKLQTFQMSINRDLHCWQLSINVTPVGLYRYFSFTINPKSSLLQDLRINRTRSFQSF